MKLRFYLNIQCAVSLFQTFFSVGNGVYMIQSCEHCQKNADIQHTVLYYNMSRIALAVICILVVSVSSASARDFRFRGTVKSSAILNSEEEPRVTLYLQISSGKTHMNKMRIIFDPRDGKMHEITWLGRKGSSLTKGPDKMPVLKDYRSHSCFIITFTGPQFDSKSHKKLSLTRFEWLKKEN